MSYTLTYLDTATDMANLLHDIVKYERERLTAISEGTMRKQDHVRADRSEVSAYNHEITTTFNALTMHYTRYQGEGAPNPYLALTPVAVQSALTAMGLVRLIASTEADLALWWSQDTELGAEIMAEQNILASDLRSLDFFLYGQACELNEATLVPSPTYID